MYYINHTSMCVCVCALLCRWECYYVKEANDHHTYQLETCMEYSISTNYYYYNDITLHVRVRVYLHSQACECASV